MSPGCADAGRVARVLEAAHRADGFLEAEEGMALFGLAREVAARGAGPLVEIGSYQGRSTLFLAAGIAAATAEGAQPTVLLAVDHHRGSEEMQAGWEHHDPDLVDAASGRMDSLERFRANVAAAGVEDVVVAVIGDSTAVAAYWPGSPGLVFVDGGHGRAVAWGDYRSWSSKLGPGALLVFHDVFPDPRDGGRPPYECYCDALGSGRFAERVEAAIGSLRVLERLPSPGGR